jgi:hypothetical protein
MPTHTANSGVGKGNTQSRRLGRPAVAGVGGKKSTTIRATPSLVRFWRLQHAPAAARIDAAVCVPFERTLRLEQVA